MRDDIPFDVWSPIFQDIYDDPDHLIDEDGSEYALSPLHRRLLIHLNLSRVSKLFYGLSKAIFYQDLQLNTHEALYHVASAVKKDVHMARLPRSLEFNFFEYRCSASSPRRPRQLKNYNLDGSTDGISHAASPTISAQRDAIRAYLAFNNYSPSMTKQSTQWITWSGYVGTILATCKGVSEVKINAKSDYSLRTARRNARHYQTLFDAPDLSINSVLSGLRVCQNLRKLHFVDPSPLLDLGPALHGWRFLRDLHIELSREFPENSDFENTAFVPPQSLESFTLLVGPPLTRWPNASDLLKCKGLRYLHLSKPNLAVLETAAALKFLLEAYRHTLESIILDIHDNSHPADITYIFNNGGIEFPHLERLHIEFGTSSMSLLERMNTPALRELSLDKIEVDRKAIDRCSDQSFWEIFLGRRSLRNLRELNILHLDHGREVLERVAIARGINIRRHVDPGVQGPPTPDWDHGMVLVDANEAAEGEAGDVVVAEGVLDE